jgi:hypothetical protein
LERDEQKYKRFCTSSRLESITMILDRFNPKPS